MATRTRTTVLLTCVNDEEFDAVLAVLHDVYQCEPGTPTHGGTYLPLGRFGESDVFLTISRMGAPGLGRMQDVVTRGITDLRPDAVIMVGIAYGVDDKKQQLGEVIVSEKLVCYSKIRFGTDDRNNITYAFDGDQPPSPLLQPFRIHARLYEKIAENPKIHIGPVLAGPGLIDNQEFRDKLAALAEKVVGGEMEGEGLFGACDAARYKVGWILVKGISDMGHTKAVPNKDEDQKRAAYEAARFVLFALSKGGVVKPAPDKPSGLPNPYDVSGLPNPYLGLRSFTYDDREAYAGRSKTIGESARLLATPGAQRSLLFVTGASGSGKSSFVQAGLLPALVTFYQKRQSIPRYAVMRPGLQPLAALIDALTQLGLPAHQINPQAVIERPARLHSFIQHATPPEQINLLVIDQFEELFTQADEIQCKVLFAFLETLPPFTHLRTYVIVTLRADYLPDLFAHKALYDHAKTGVDLRAMGVDELKDAIQRPIQLAEPERRIEPGLLKKLATDTAGDAAYLPLLQVTLQDLWRRGSLTLDAYGSLTDAIGDWAEAVYHYRDYDGTRQQARTPKEQAMMMDLLLDLVEVSLDDNARRDVRRRRKLAELTRGEPGHERLIDDLATARLLSKGIEQHAAGDVEVVDIIHESLIANWARLNKAIADKRTVLQRRARFELALRDWVAQHKLDDYLLDGGTLAEAQLLAESNDVALRSADARELLGRSLKRREELEQRELARARAFAREQQRRADAEKARADAEKSQAEEQRRRAESEAKGRRNLRFGAVALGLVTIGALLAAGLAALFNVQAQERASEAQTAEARALQGEADLRAQLRISDAQRLAAAAQSELSRGNTELATLLARAAVMQADNAQTQFSLFAALSQRSPWKSTVIAQYDSEVEDIALSPDGSKILTSTREGVAQLWNFQGQLLATFKAPFSYAGIDSVSFSKDGRKILAVASPNVYLWSVEGELMHTFEQEYGFDDALFSPDGTKILTISDEKARLWDLNGNLFATLEGHTDSITVGLFNPNGATLVTGSEDDTARLWDLNGNLLAILEGHTGPVRHITFSPDGSYILTASSSLFNGDIRALLWNKDGVFLGALNGHTGWINSVRFSPDGAYIVTTSRDETARVWDLNGQALSVFSLRSWGGEVSFSPDGEHIIIESARGVQVWNTKGKLVGLLEGHTDAITAAFFSLDGSQIITGSYDGTVRLWKKFQSPFLSIGDNFNNIGLIEYVKDGKHFLTGSTDGTVRLWSPEGRVLITFLAHNTGINSLAMSPSGQRILTTAADGTAKLWRVDGTLLAVLQHSTNAAVHTAIFSRDEKMILSEGAGIGAYLWTIEGQQISSFNGLNARFDFEEKHVIIASDTSVEIRSITGELVSTFKGHTDRVLQVVPSPDGKHILSASEDKTARLWDITGRLITVFEGHTDTISDALFSPGGENVLTISHDNTMRLWELDGTLIWSQVGNPGIRSAKFSPDGSRIISVTGDGAASLWLKTGELYGILQKDLITLETRYSNDSTRILIVLTDGVAYQHPVATEDLKNMLPCFVGRNLTSEELSTYQVSRELLPIDLDSRQCPPKLSWDHP